MKKTLLSLQSVLSRCCLLLALLAVSVSAMAQQKTLNFTYFKLTEGLDSEKSLTQNIFLSDKTYAPVSAVGRMISVISHNKVFPFRNC